MLMKPVEGVVCRRAAILMKTVEGVVYSEIICSIVGFQTGQHEAISEKHASCNHARSKPHQTAQAAHGVREQIRFQNGALCTSWLGALKKANAPEAC